MPVPLDRTVDRLIRRHRRDRNTLGIMLFGSMAKGVADRYSDIDLYVLLRRKGRWSRENFTVGQRRADVLFDTLPELKRSLREERYSLRRVTSQMLAHGRLLHDPTGAFARLQGTARQNLELPTRSTRAEMLMHLYSIDDFWGEAQRDLERQDYVAWQIDSHLLIQNTVELVLRRRRQYLRQPNEMGELLREADPALLKLISRFASVQSFPGKRRALGQIVKHAYRAADGPMPRQWRIR